MRNIVWLASYPKSGNTWLRTFLTCLVNRNKELQINELIAPILSSRVRVDEYLLLESSELTHDEVDNYTPLFLREFSKDIVEAPFFMKAHNAYTHTTKGEPLYPADISIGAIYIIRNVLDVVVSLAYHNNDTIENTIKLVAKADHSLVGKTNDVKSQTRQILLSWDKHFTSWKQQDDISVHFVRYEDMLEDSFKEFKKIADFAGLKYTDADIQDAINQTSFEKLRSQEQSIGFKERPSRSKVFFRKGKTGSWRESLTDEQAKLIIEQHRDVMLELGYIDEDGNPLY